MTPFRRLTLATTLTTLGVIGVGGLVRATGSGDGCPDWPRCFGKWIPPLEYHALIEYSHRTVGAIAIGLLLTATARAFLRHRQNKGIIVPLSLAAPLILMQAVLGAIVVKVKTSPDLRYLESSLVTFHIATAMTLVALLVIATVNAGEPRQPDPGGARLARLGRWSVAGTFGLILIGAAVRGEHAGLAFADFPLMNGSLLPELSGPAALHFAHRAAALLVGVLVGFYVVAAVRARARHRATAMFASTTGVLFVAQIMVGGAQVWTKLGAPAVTAHVALASAIWASVVAAAALGPRARDAAAQSPPAQPSRAVPAPISGAQVDALPLRRTDVLRAYTQLTKPRIIVLLVITTVPTMILAAGVMPSAGLILATVAGGVLAAGSANAINMYLDRDIDAVMTRTRARPLPAHRIPPRNALRFAFVLAGASFALMVGTVNVPAALLAQSAIAFYVFVYTMALKRSTPQNIVIGGAAGAVPVLVGWAAVTGSLGIEALLLFLVIFLWTPAHFWALAVHHAEDYASAGVPMMPVVAGPEATKRQIVAYAAATWGVTLALIPVAGMGPLYVVAAAGLGAWFVAHAVRLLRDGSARAAMSMFRFSISYLAVLFVAVGLDALIQGTP